MSVDEDTYTMMSSFCEECNAEGCRARELSYDDDGQDAIDFIYSCKHYQDACEILKLATRYERVL
jgi:hypothetical protein